MNSPSENLLRSAALDYARRGWPVLPLQPNDKRPLTKHGLLDATSDFKQVVTWWTVWPDANVGLRTGETFDVLDLDGPEAIKSLEPIWDNYRHDGPVAATGKGWHLYFAVTKRRNGARLVEKVDFRGINGYVVAPPSIHPSGRIYTWVEARGPELPLPPAPKWLHMLFESDYPTLRTTATPAERAFANSPKITDLRLALEQMGANFRSHGSQRLVSNCVFHAEDTPSLVLYPATTNEPDNFFCFGCGAWGNALNVDHHQNHGRLSLRACPQCDNKP